MVLLIDNYDSFSYNLYQYIGTIVNEKNLMQKGENSSDLQSGVNESIRVIRNDELTVEEIKALKPTCIIISPGPGKPSDAGVCEDVIRSVSKEIPTLGVCLGHQAICEAFGATVTYAKQLMHGKQSEVTLKADPIFEGLGDTMLVARYHSLAADNNTIPDCLKVLAVTKDNEVMAVKHKDYPIYGLQFHPESILTPDGMTLLKNFMNM